MGAYSQQVAEILRILCCENLADRLSHNMDFSVENSGFPVILACKLSRREYIMKCENMIGKTFGNISQRLIYSYLCSYPEFQPISSIVNRESQKQMYDFLWEFVSGVYLDPQKLGLPTDEDENPS
jgi:hypothetical protein